MATGSSQRLGGFSQRCAVRVTYSANRTMGQWAAHGRYLTREGASQAESGKPLGFDDRGEVGDLDSTLAAWQRAGDPRLFKLIISPEFGDRLNLQGLTRSLIAKMEVDLGTRLQWVGTVHRNTEYPHVHVALRGITDDGQPLRLARNYIKHGIRTIAENLATAELGYRTEMDAQEAQRREIHQQRYTSLDRTLQRANANSDDDTRHDFFAFDLNGLRYQAAQKHSLNGRLLFLESMGLAEPIGGGRWNIRFDFDTVLRGMQRTADRQRALAARSALLSDTRLSSKMTDLHNIQNLAGRVLGHCEDESSGRSYMILEGIDHVVHFIYHSPEMQAMRRKAKLQSNSFIQFQHQWVDDKHTLSIDDLGSADGLLMNKQHLRTTVGSLLRRGIIPTESGLSGWLGKYEAALAQTARELHSERERVISIGATREGGR